MDTISPTITANDWLTDASSALANTSHSLDALHTTSTWAMVGTGLIIALGIARQFLPGPYAAIVNMIWDRIVPTVTRQQDARVQQLAGVACQLIPLIDKLPPEHNTVLVNAIKADIDFTPEQEAEIRRVRNAVQ